MALMKINEKRNDEHFSLYFHTPISKTKINFSLSVKAFTGLKSIFRQTGTWTSSGLVWLRKSGIPFGHLTGIDSIFSKPRINRRLFLVHIYQQFTINHFQHVKQTNKLRTKFLYSPLPTRTNVAFFYQNELSHLCHDSLLRILKYKACRVFFFFPIWTLASFTNWSTSKQINSPPASNTTSNLWKGVKTLYAASLFFFKSVKCKLDKIFKCGTNFFKK